jgi:transglutaminase-like putative cysteine protease
MDPFLRPTSVIDHGDPAVRALADELASADPVETARRAFDWVSARIFHSEERPEGPVPCTASEVLAAGSGSSFAKCHLLAALLRANGIPAALAYQRLPHGDAFVLHGLVACGLPSGWYLCDPRGSAPGHDARFTPPEERLAHAGPDVVRVPGLFPDALPIVVEALRRHRTYADLAAHLPDWTD